MKLRGMERCRAGALGALLALAASAPTGGRAAGLLIADGGFGGAMEIVDHDVRVSINNGIAVTRVTQVFRNKENRQVEALYTFPVPRGASVANFSMWINGKEMVGEVLEKKRAREIYNSYKQQRRDPGLLEQVDYRTFEMRIFPIAAQAEQRVEIAYYQELDTDHDAFTYVYPLATTTRRDADSRTTGRFSMTMDLKSAIPLTALESPSHADRFVVAKHTPEYAQASFETRGGRLDRDIVVAGRLERPRTGLDLLVSRRNGEDGFFQLTVTAGEDLAKLDTGMDHVFVLDVSGSMGDDGKLATSKQSLGAFIRTLEPDDRFEVVSFSMQPSPLFRGLQPANTQNVERAVAFLDSLAARGSTVLHPALGLAYQYGEADRPLNVVVLSDGLTEQKERQDLTRLIRERPRNARVFCIGVGNDVNRPLLEQMAEDSGGLAAFVSGDDRFDRQAQAFRRKLARPAASRLQLKIAGVETYDLEPAVLPDLYHGSPLRIYGRYKGDGPAKIEFGADVRGFALKQTAELSFPKVDDANPELERMWAWKRVDRLLKTADRGGSRDTVIPEIVALGELYSIVTEYTSFLVLENDAEYKRWKIDRRNLDRIAGDRDAQDRRERLLVSLREKAVNDLGPAAAERAASPAAAPRAPSAVPVANPAPAAVPAPTVSQSSPSPSRSSRSWDFSLGSGPVGPLFVLYAAWLKRRRKTS